MEGCKTRKNTVQFAYIMGINHPVRNFDGRVIAVVRRHAGKGVVWVVAPKSTRYIVNDIREAINFAEGRIGYNIECLYESSCGAVIFREENNEKKMNRYRKILLEACEQCKRSSLVELAPMSTLLQCRDMLDADIKLIAYESADVKSQHIKDVLLNAQDVKSVAVVIGCEGGFSEDEVATFEQAGFIRVSLGGRILRAETAAMAAITMIDYHYC
jgi:hypothetical protein